MPKIKGYPTNPVNLGDHLRKKRMDLNITQKRVSEILGTTEDTITYWENGRSKPQATYYNRIFKFLGYVPILRSKLTFGQQLFYARIIAGISLSELANHVGLCKDSLYYIERDRRKILDETNKILTTFIEQQFKSVTFYQP